MTYSDGVGSSTASAPNGGDCRGSGGILTNLGWRDYNYNVTQTSIATYKTFTVTYSGGVPATGVAVTLSPGTYYNKTTDCGATVSSNCTITVAFTPTSQTTFNDSINVRTTTVLRLKTRQEIWHGAKQRRWCCRPIIAGTLVTSTWVISMAPKTWKSFMISNSASGGSAAATLSSATFTSGSNFAFPRCSRGFGPGIRGDCNMGQQLPAQTCHFWVKFVPSSSGAYTDTVNFNYGNGFGSSSVNSTMNGQGFAIGAVKSGGDHSCGNMLDGRISCWGYIITMALWAKIRPLRAEVLRLLYLG